MHRIFFIAVLSVIICSSCADSEKKSDQGSKQSKKEVQFEDSTPAQDPVINQPSGYEVGVDSPLRKVFGTASDFTGQTGVPARISLARGEYESVQVVILTKEEPLHSVDVSASDLTGPGGTKLPASAVTIHLVGYVEVTNHPEKDETTGQWWPDPLLANAPFGVEALHAQPVWITVHAPTNARAGQYQGFFTIAPQGLPETRLPLQVTVWDFELSPENHLKTTFPLFWHRREVSGSEFGQWAAFALSYRLGIMTVGWGMDGVTLTSQIRRTDTGYDYSRIDADVQFCFSRHMNSASMGDSPAGDFAEEHTAERRRFLGDYAAHLKQRGWLDMFYYKLQDEPSPQMYKVVRDQGASIKSIDPDIKRLCTVPIVPELIGFVDLWCPLTPDYDKVKAEAARRRGEEIWTYTCMAPLPPAPNIAFIRQDALGHRLLPWQCWELGADGYLYWGIKNWPFVNTGRDTTSAWSWAEGLKSSLAAQEQAGKHWPRLGWFTAEGGLPPGDGYLAYPGPGGMPLPSIRLECFRDGIEDYEYLYLLRQRARDLRKAGKADAVARVEKLLAEAVELGTFSEDNWDPTPDRLFDLRRRIAEELTD